MHEFKSARPNCTVSYAIIDAGNGDNTVVAATTGQKIRVLALSLSGAAARTALFESDDGGGSQTAITGTLKVATTLELPFSPVGWFETSAGHLLNLAANGDIDGVIVYQKVVL